VAFSAPWRALETNAVRAALMKAMSEGYSGHIRVSSAAFRIQLKMHCTFQVSS